MQLVQSDALLFLSASLSPSIRNTLPSGSRQIVVTVLCQLEGRLEDVTSLAYDIPVETEIWLYDSHVMASLCLWFYDNEINDWLKYTIFPYNSEHKF
ncbi:hypothetical protein CEXT_84411 [Caerostris extrusa]|uniref:Uncharacterized protein n=1 Tax=Caerostris extrusa TaxID=172846 RepID=A0AAV4UWU9_CAEEX|nr:hypothetical protein CEXT_84411 [Caerostris extrusa]